MPYRFNRVRSNHNLEKTCEDVWKEEAEVLATLQKRMKKTNSTTAKASMPFKAGGVDPSQLVQIRWVHQTRRARKSVRPVVNNCEEPQQSTAGSQRRQICKQMADVINRMSTGLERGLWWKSGVTPGTKDLAEASLLKGNSANAELAAGERVKAVRSQFHRWDIILTVAPGDETPERTLYDGKPFKILT